MKRYAGNRAKSLHTVDVQIHGRTVQLRIHASSRAAAEQRARVIAGEFEREMSNPHELLTR